MRIKRFNQLNEGKQSEIDRLFGKIEENSKLIWEYYNWKDDDDFESIEQVMDENVMLFEQIKKLRNN